MRESERVNGQARGPVEVDHVISFIRNSRLLERTNSKNLPAHWQVLNIPNTRGIFYVRCIYSNQGLQRTIRPEKQADPICLWNPWVRRTSAKEPDYEAKN